MNSLFLKQIFFFLMVFAPIQLFAKKSNPLQGLVAGQEVPRELLEDSDLKKVARDLLHHQFDSKTKQSCSGNKKPTLQKYKTELQVVVNAKNLPSILKQGLLNYHQVKTADSDYEKTSKGRAIHEDEMLGLQIEKGWKGPLFSQANQLRPKYAFLAFPEAPLNEQPMRRISQGYGNTILVLKDSLKDRSTLCVGDSDNQRAKFDHIFLFNTCSAEILQPAYYNDISHSGGNPKQPSFLEVEIWGPIDPSEIDYAIVNCPWFGPTDSSDLKKAEQILPLPIYNCVEERIDGNAVRFKKGALFNF